MWRSEHKLTVVSRLLQLGPRAPTRVVRLGGLTGSGVAPVSVDGWGEPRTGTGFCSFAACSRNIWQHPFLGPECSAGLSPGLP